MSVSLEVSKREVRPRSLKRELRHTGKIPAIVNGYQIASTPISLVAADLERLLRENGVNSVITMKLDDKIVNTLIEHYTTDTFTGKITHIEFLSVNMNVDTEVEADIVLVGESVGVKAGGTLAQTLYHVLVSATPDKLPEHIELDVSKLNIGDSLVVGDIPKSPDYDIITNPKEHILAVIEPKASTEDDEEEEN